MGSGVSFSSEPLRAVSHMAPRPGHQDCERIPIDSPVKHTVGATVCGQLCEELLVLCEGGPVPFASSGFFVREF